MRMLLLGAAAAAMAAAPAWAGPAHVLLSRTLGPAPVGAAYAVAPMLDGRTRAVLSDALQAAGLRVTPPDQPHAYLVTVQAGASVLCTSSCSATVLHDDSNLDDYYRHKAVVVAQANTGTQFRPAGPVTWFTVLQSDGLSSKRSDYLPALLRYGARAYGRDTAPETPPHLAPRLTPLPDVGSGPGA